MDEIVPTEPLCFWCKHFEQAAPLRCAAFPDGIPDDIIKVKVAHTKPLPGDHGIQFESMYE